MKTLNYLNKSENSLAILLAIAALSMMYPYGFPLFGLAVFFFGALKLFTGRFKVRINIGFILFFLSILAYFAGMSFNQGIIYSLNISDLTNIISFLIIWAILSDLDDYPNLIHKFSKYVVFICSTVAIISLYKFNMLMSGVQLEQFKSGINYPAGTSLVSDYNMFSFGLTVGLIMVVYLMNNSHKLIHTFYYLISFTTIFTSIMFAGSRRAWIVALFVVAFVIIMAIKKLIDNRIDKNIIRFFKFSFIAGFSALFIFLFMTLFNIEIEFENSRQIETLKYRFETMQLAQAQESFSPRTDRWDYAAQLFDESNPIEFLFGQGFGYLTDFANKFNTGEVEDYPHNPFLSTLLYSGLLGLMLLISLIIYSFVMAVKNRNVLGIHFSFFYSVSWIFVIISFNSIFSNTLLFMTILFIVSMPSQQREGI